MENEEMVFPALFVSSLLHRLHLRWLTETVTKHAAKENYPTMLSLRMCSAAPKQERGMRNGE